MENEKIIEEIVEPIKEEVKPIEETFSEHSSMAYLARRAAKNRK